MGGEASEVADLSPEQQVMVAVLCRQHDRATAERIVRSARVDAYLIGSHITPILEQMVVLVAEMLALAPRRGGSR